MTELGAISGKVTLNEFTFRVTGPVRRNEYLKVFHSADGWVLSQVLSISKFSEGESPTNAAPRTGGGVQVWREATVARAGVIGFKEPGGPLRLPRTPFSPGDRVFTAEPELLARTLGLGEQGIYLGHLDSTPVRVHLSPNTLITRHGSILAKTGAGKSYAAAVIMEELLERETPLVIVDPHGEYPSLKEPAVDTGAMARFGIEPGDYADRVTIYTPISRAVNPKADKLFRLDGVNLKARTLAGMLSDVTSRQMALLQQAVRRAAAARELYSLPDIIQAVEESTSNERWGLLSSLESLQSSGILSDSPTTIDELVQPGHASVLDLKGLEPRIQEMVVAVVGRELFEARKLNRIPPVLLLVEESHEFCPERGFKKAVSSDILRTIASEGRKFGLGLFVVSQRPARVDKNVLSQCGTQIILRVTNPNDIQVLRKSLEGFTDEMGEELRRLPPGTAIVVSGDIERPVVVNIRPRRTRHGGAAKVV
ncbi:MAG: ATP-binding protein [Euryarchaeota archaeon]|nr:ATP-binding protein [Euryarchaeota archaeon]